MNNITWIKYWFIFLLLIIPSLIGLNYLIDPLNILHTNFLKADYQINERFMKIEFLEENNDSYNSYMFGSSRIGSTNTGDIEKHLPGSKFYNMTIGSGNLNDYITHLKFFIKRKYPIDNIYLQIDIDNMAYFGNSHMGYLGKYHPQVTNDSLNLFYLNYLTNFLPMSIIGKLKRNFIEINKRHTYHLTTTGVIEKKYLEARVSKNCSSYVKTVASFKKKNKRTVSGIYMNEAINALKKIVNLSNKNNIALYIFTTPHNQNMMDTFKIQDYLEFIKRIASVVDFYDFSGYNSITTDNCNYYEYSHYRPKIGKLIAKRIFTGSAKDLPEDFGILVTKENIENHLDKALKNINKHDKNKLK